MKNEKLSKNNGRITLENGLYKLCLPNKIWMINKLIGLGGILVHSKTKLVLTAIAKTYYEKERVIRH